MPQAEVRIERTNHSLFAARVAPELSAEEGGVLLNAAGGHGEKGTFGVSAPWCDVSGTRFGLREGIAIFDSPRNRWYPSKWFTRDYGFFSPTPFNWLDDAGLRLAKGETLELEYLVVVHAGDAGEAGIAGLFAAWAAERATPRLVPEWSSAPSWARRSRSAGERAHEEVVEREPAHDVLRADALVAAVGADVVDVEKDARRAERRDPGRPQEAAVAAPSSRSGTTATPGHSRAAAASTARRTLGSIGDAGAVSFSMTARRPRPLVGHRAADAARTSAGSWPGRMRQFSVARARCGRAFGAWPASTGSRHRSCAGARCTAGARRAARSPRRRPMPAAAALRSAATGPDSRSAVRSSCARVSGLIITGKRKAATRPSAAASS